MSWVSPRWARANLSCSVGRCIKCIFGLWYSQVALVVKNLPASAGDLREADMIPGLGRSPGEGNGSPLHYSCLENSIDWGAWQAGSWAARGPAKSRTRLKWLSTAYFQVNDGLTSGYKFNIRDFPGDSVVKNPPAMQEMQEMGVRSPGRSPGRENGNRLQSSCLGNPLNREAWWATVHGVAKELETIEDTHTHTTPTWYEEDLYYTNRTHMCIHLSMDKHISTEKEKVIL